MPKNKTWFDVQARAANAEAEVLIYDAIGAYGVTAKDLVNQIKKLEASRIVVRINSPGGEVFDGTAIHNALKDHKATVAVHIDGVAASAASFIAMAGDEITIAKNAYMMVHEAWGLVQGPAGDMRHLADVLDKMNAAIAQMYADRSGKPAAEWRDVMAAETWYLGQEAVDAGLCDGVDETAAEPATAKASFNYAIFNKIPDPLRRAWGVPTTAQNKSGLNVVEVPRGTHAPAATNKDEDMKIDLDSFNAFAAENPKATEQFVNQGYDRAKAELTPKEATASDLLAAFPGDKGFCMDQLAANATMGDAHKAWATELTAKLAKAEADKGELQKRLDLAGKGADPLNLGGSATAAAVTDPATIEDPKARAKAEWDAKLPDCGNFASQESYINYRAAVLNGSLRVK